MQDMPGDRPEVAHLIKQVGYLISQQKRTGIEDSGMSQMQPCDRGIESRAHGLAMRQPSDASCNCDRCEDVGRVMCAGVDASESEKERVHARQRAELPVDRQNPERECEPHHRMVTGE